MSKIGNISNYFGNNFDIAIANTTSENVMSASSLPQSSVILAVPFDRNSSEDVGPVSMLMTDYEGSIVRLTYCISEGNGLYNIDDMLKLQTDNDTLQENINGLSINVENLINDNSLIMINDKLSLNIDSLPYASDTTYGVSFIDELTLNTHGDTLYVDTMNLDLASTNLFGIAMGDNTTIYAEQGRLSILYDGLEKCTYNNFGLSRPDNMSTVSNNGVVSLRQEFFINDRNIGIVKVDGTTLSATNGIVSINKNNLKKASYTEAGILSLGNEFYVDSSGRTSLHVEALTQELNNIDNRIESLNEKLDNIENTAIEQHMIV